MTLEVVNKTNEVYGISRDLPLNYVSRQTVDLKFIESLTLKKHIIIYGSSKQGKTSLRKHCLNIDDYIVIQCSNNWTLAELHSAILKKIGYQIVQSNQRSVSGKQKIIASMNSKSLSFGTQVSKEYEFTKSETISQKPLELDPDDVNDIIKALGDFNKFIVLEDFHYLLPETQRDFSVALKAFHEQSSLTFIIVGVWLEESRLTVYNGDLTGRVIGINADEWTYKELEEVIQAGEYLLNIKFTDDFKSSLLESCFESVYIVQETCYKACLSSGHYETLPETVSIGDGLNVKSLIQEVVDQQSGRYNSFISQFSSGFQDTTLEMYKWILFPILTSNTKELEKGLKYRHIRELLKKNHPQKDGLNPGNITQALQSTASLQNKKGIKPIILDYDQTNNTLNVVDKGFLIWLDNQDRNELLELASLPTL
jgi:AAA+ ATPase superfamily predicted ATPase